VGRAARPNVAQYARIPARQVFGTDRGDRAGAHVGQVTAVDDRLWDAVARVHEQEQSDLGWQAFLVVVDVVADHLDAREVDRRAERTAQPVEMPRYGRIRHQMHARLDDRLAPTLRRESGLDGGEDFVVG